MIRNHKIGALSILLFIIGMIVAFGLIEIAGYGIAGGLKLAMPNFVIYNPVSFIISYVVLITIILTVVSTTLTYNSIKGNRPRLLEFSAGFVIAIGGFLLGYLVYWVHKKLFNKKSADIYSYIIAFSITFVIFLILVSLGIYISIYTMLPVS